MGKIEIALLAGGWSGEREISIKSGEAVYRSLDRKRYNVTWYDPLNDLESLLKKRQSIDLAFVLLHGKFGEDGRIQGFLDILNIPFVGSGLLSSAMASNKWVAKGLYRNAGLDVIKDAIIHRGNEFSPDWILESVGPSMVVKPVSEGSSLGISVCHGRDELMEGINLAFQYDQEVMIERYIKGREVTCCVIGGIDLETLPIVEIVPDKGHHFFDYTAKYTPGVTNEICPADLPVSLAKKVEICAKKAHQALGCSVWSRSDMIVHRETVYVLETNTIPGMTENSLVPLAARAAGIGFSELLDRLIELSLDKKVTC